MSSEKTTESVENNKNIANNKIPFLSKLIFSLFTLLLKISRRGKTRMINNVGSPFPSMPVPSIANVMQSKVIIFVLGFVSI